MHLGEVLVPLPGAHKQIKPHNCHPDAESLSQSHADSLATGPDSMSSHILSSADSMGFFCHDLDSLSSFNPCSLSSSGLSELSLVVGNASLHLLPSVTG